jgi:hypothetical protein
MSEWQPISTAPKDGQTIVLFGEGLVTVGGWVSAADQGAEPSEEYSIAADWWSLDLRNNAPTHWMPLPDPPQDVTARQSVDAAGEVGGIERQPSKGSYGDWTVVRETR